MPIRCELDEAELAARVAEHLRPLDPRGLADVPRGNLDALATRAEALRVRAPFAPRLPFAPTPREQRLRHYLAAFGIEVPPRVDGEREKAEAQLATVLEKVTLEKKKKPSIVHIWAPAPGPEGEALARSMRKLKTRHIELRWTLPSFEPALDPTPGGLPVVEEVVRGAIQMRVRASQARAERALRGMGIRARAVERRRAVSAVATKGADEP